MDGLIHGGAGLVKALIHLLMKLKLNIRKSIYIYMLTIFTADNLEAKPVSGKINYQA